MTASGQVLLAVDWSRSGSFDGRFHTCRGHCVSGALVIRVTIFASPRRGSRGVTGAAHNKDVTSTGQVGTWPGRRSDGG